MPLDLIRNVVEVKRVTSRPIQKCGLGRLSPDPRGEHGCIPGARAVTDRPGQDRKARLETGSDGHPERVEHSSRGALEDHGWRFTQIVVAGEAGDQLGNRRYCLSDHGHWRDSSCTSASHIIPRAW